MSLAGTGGTAEESEIKRSAAFRWPFAAPVDVEVTSYTVGVLRLFDPFLADFSGSLLCHGVESWEFTTVRIPGFHPLRMVPFRSSRGISR